MPHIGPCTTDCYDRREQRSLLKFSRNSCPGVDVRRQAPTSNGQSAWPWPIDTTTLKCAACMLRPVCSLQVEGDVHVDIMDPNAGQYQQQLQVPTPAAVRSTMFPLHSADMSLPPSCSWYGTSSCACRCWKP